MISVGLEECGNGADLSWLASCSTMRSTDERMDVFVPTVLYVLFLTHKIDLEKSAVCVHGGRTAVS